MPRYIFSPTTITSTGQPQRLQFYDRAVGGQRLTDLYTIDGSDNIVDAIPSGVVLTTALGVISSFAGPDDRNPIYMSVNGSSSRTAITAVRGSLAQGDLAGTYSHLVATPAASTTLTGTAAASTLTSVDCTAGAGARTLPAASAVVAGVTVVVKKSDTSANALVVTAAGSDLIFGTGAGSATKTLTLAGEAVTFVSNGVDRWTVAASDTPSGVLSSTYGRHFMPEGYGAAAAYSAVVDDTAAVQAAITAAIAVRGAVRLTRVYNVTGLTITSPVMIVGTGGLLKGGLSPASGLNIDSTTAHAISISSSGVTLRDFAIVNRSATTPTTSCGVIVNTDASLSWGDLTLIDHVDISAFAVGVRMNAGSYWRIQNCYIYDSAVHGIRISNANNVDGGDQFITSNAILTSRIATGSAIYWESGGGVKIVGNKINAAASGSFLHGIMFEPTGSTSVAVVTGNSIENTRISSMYAQASSLTWKYLIFTSNQCSMYTPTGSPNGLIVISGLGLITNLLVANNTLTGTSAHKYGVWVDGVNQPVIGKNSIDGAVQGGVYLGATNSAAEAIPPSMTGTVTLIRDELSRSDSTNKGVALIDHRYGRQIPTTGKVTASTLWSVVHTQNDSCIVTLTLNGAIAGVGAYLIKAVRQIERATSGVCTLTTIGTDISSGTAVADVTLTFDAATTTGEVLIKVILAGGSAGTNIYGRATMTIEGGPNMVKRGAATTPA